ncbi:fucose-specific lectin [Stipitochalara longipes BDJ]|nr:fucose-specific lectin [Stipitochalara longipes BDJ]
MDPAVTPQRPSVPAGWTPEWSSEYQTWFYVNDYTARSTWELPTELAQAPTDTNKAAAQASGNRAAGLVEHERHKHENQPHHAGITSQISTVSTHQDFGIRVRPVGGGTSWMSSIHAAPKYLYKPSLISMVSWGPSRLDAFTVGTTSEMYHQASDGSGWVPNSWECLAGSCSIPPSVTTGGLNNLGIYVLGTNDKLYSKWWLNNAWGPSMTDYHTPTIVTRGLNRTDIFCLDTDRQMLHKYFASPAAVVSCEPNSMVAVCLGIDGQIYHKAFWGNEWHPSVAGWDALGGPFISAPTITARGPDRFDIFAVGADYNMHHRWWDHGTWSQSWEVHSGTLGSMPVSISWGNRLDVFAIGVDGVLLHKAYEGNRWAPSLHEWESHGGCFHGAPAAACWGFNRIDVLAVAQASADPQHKSWNGSTWTTWATLGGKAKLLK